MNKILFIYCQKHLRLIEQGEFKANASLKSLANDYNIGYIDNGIFYFKRKDKQHLIELVASLFNGIRLSDPFPEQLSRINIAETQRNEKLNALKVSEDFVLINSLSSICLNSEIMNKTSINTLGHFICSSEIKTIEHQQIVLVENLIVMANLARLNIPKELKGALWLYRGDAQDHKQTGTAYQLFRRFNTSHKLICFSDLDPSGLQICLTSGASEWLTLRDENQLCVELQGTEKEWFNQTKDIKYLNGLASLPVDCDRLFMKMKGSQKTLKQEHMLQHSLKLALFPLS